MALEIKISPELEQQLQQAAAQAGVAPDVYAMRLLEQGLSLTRLQSNSVKRLSSAEAELLQRINHSLSQIDWNRYRTLLTKRDNAVLTLDEQAELIALSDRVEAINVDRIQALTELAKTRQRTVKDLIAELGLKPIAHA
ncbi:MAG: hypothetical protein HC840_28735 [Leptolyngbyaceae cyanobacterium RM2_2_4]|nr:hypothetical protein [Leptolyngbyaceae cyanobacterium SM1_4_3]NJN90294.1 hypothetical protein [Leptolyngbyaceae cyanobacterium SL_5_14]NJO52724.1 hypothetical protein [Leptolyngbyaceae cyanobacterium RM2_2_4]